MISLSKKSSIYFLAILVVFAFGFLSFTFTGKVFAQEESLPVYLRSTPDHPEPNQQVSFLATSYLADLDRATLRWYVNGKLMESGRGLDSFTTKVGDAGKTTIVRLSVETQNGTIVNISKTFRPMRVDLLWESSAYVPPFYKGKALVGAKSDVRVVAVPQTGSASLSQKNYTYTWTKDGKKMSSESGYGKNIFQFSTLSADQPVVIGVEVNSDDGLVTANGSLTVYPTQPKLVIYPYSAAYGTEYNTAIGNNFDVERKEISFSAVPYFASGSEISFMTYEWGLNGDSVGDSFSPILTLRNDDGQKGTANVTVRAVLDRLNRSEQKGFSISF